MQYRADIQILRGISVLLVVLFHLGFNSFQSGFLGVDVFFVISGFLMAVLYDHRDIKGFFKRRAIRLLPAFYVTIVFTVVCSTLFLTRNESVQVFHQAYLGSIFASNIGFWFENSYFSDSAFKPLLHLWSLGVEVQFYLMVPLLAFFFRKSKWLLIGFTVISVVLCFWATTVSPKTSFFITPFRVWEFLIGYSVAIFFSNNGNTLSSNTSRRYYGIIGVVALLIIPLLPVDGEATSYLIGHPGIFSLLVTIFTAAVLFFGLPVKLESSIIGKVLVKLGEYSYSIYLVHFPVIVIYNSKPFMGTIYGTESYYDLVKVVLIIAVLSIFLHLCVEKQKLPKLFSNNWRMFTLLSSLLIMILATSANTLQDRSLDPTEKVIFSAENDRSVYRCGKAIRILDPKAAVCELTGIPENEAVGSIMLAGNSHADAAKPAFIKAAKESNFNLFFFVSNSVMNTDGPSVKFIVNQAKINSVSTIFVHQFEKSFDTKMLSDLISEAMESDIDIVYVEPVPTWNVDIPSSMWKIEKGLAKNLIEKQSISDYYKKTNIFSELDNIESDNFSRVSTVNTFCKPQCDYSNEDSTPLYFDRHHLTATGAERLYPIISDALIKLKIKLQLNN
ncbi:acyltransferase family protein [Marinomonas algarum]|uniref:Acyltransferase n=1 Tax=Marinomonas algarum TaxID=2883105 RepID=A0A9X1LEH8_9GAMM|nr:acyltransferase family protein [Marinomonas algarum]MCB5161501.1 acyltransferase [Marinomonas algarum]